MQNSGQTGRGNERGTMVLVVMMIAIAIAAIAGITSGRVLHETRGQRLSESETSAINDAYAQLQLAINLIVTSDYDAADGNMTLRDAIAGVNGGTADAGWYAPPSSPAWLDAATDPTYGLLRGTSVRVYRAREYLTRLDRLLGEDRGIVDPTARSDSYFVLEATGRSGDRAELVSLLVREKEPFSSYVFFQNKGTLGVSGAPRGRIHGNSKVAFYLPNGSYVDSVTSVAGFEYHAGATIANTDLRDANDGATAISLENVDFADLKSKAALFAGQDGLDARIGLQSDGDIVITEYTKPRFEMEVRSYTYDRLVGTEEVTETVQQQVQIDTLVETTIVQQQVQVGTTIETTIEQQQVQVGTTTEERTDLVPVYGEREVTRTRWVQVFVPYDDGSAGGGTAVGGGSGSVPGEWVWVEEEYTATETYIVRYDENTYEVTLPVYETQDVEVTDEVPVYEMQGVEVTTETPVYEMQDVEVTTTVGIYEETTNTWEAEVYVAPQLVSSNTVSLGDGATGVIYIDGRITSLQGSVLGRLTIVSGDSVRITGDVRYVDAVGATAMLNGNDYTEPFVRNPDYSGSSVLGVIARKDVLYTRYMDEQAEVNGVLMAVEGRVGIDGFWADNDGELHEDSYSSRHTLLSAEQADIERAYDRASLTRTYQFTNESLRRLGGLISNNRILETYVVETEGYAVVDSGFKRGSAQYDAALAYNPPPEFAETHRPMILNFLPLGRRES